MAWSFILSQGDFLCANGNGYKCLLQSYDYLKYIGRAHFKICLQTVMHHQMWMRPVMSAVFASQHARGRSAMQGGKLNHSAGSGTNVEQKSLQESL